MLKSLFSGVSGLQSHQVAMDVESNNIANVNTVGFKYSRANFSDLLAQTKAIATAPQGALGGKNPVQVGLGSTVSSMTRIFSQGSVQNSDKNTDVAIQGDGFYVVSPDGGNTYKYTRAGDFKFDAGGNFVDNNGFIVQGWLRDKATGKVDSTAPITNINIPPGLTTPAQASAEVVLKANLNSGPLVESFSPAYKVLSGPPPALPVLPALDKNGNAIASGNLGVMFNEVGEAFSLQKSQGVWMAFQSSTKTDGGATIGSQKISTFSRAFVAGDNASATVNGNFYTSAVSYANLAALITAGEPTVTVAAAGNTLTFDETTDAAYTVNNLANDDGSVTGPVTVADNNSASELNITFTLDDNTTKTIQTSGSTGTESAAQNGARYVSAINAQASITGITATYDTANNKILLLNSNGSASASHNIRLTSLGNANSGLTTSSAFGAEVTAYRYRYDPTGSSNTVGVDKTFTTISDLRYAMELQAQDNDSNGTPNSNITIEINEQGKFEINNPSGGTAAYDVNLQITAIVETGITENPRFTTNMSALNSVLPVGSGGKAFSQSFNAATHSSSIDVFDSLGSKHTLRMEFRKTAVDTATGATWSMLLSVPAPATIDTVAPRDEKAGSIRFNNDGSLATFNPPNISFTGNNGSAPDQQINLSFGTANAFNGVTSFDNLSATSGISQDGFTGGDLVGIRIDQSGTLVGSFSNGRSFGLAQIGMAKFTNNEGLSTEGGNIFIQTANSGDPIIGTAATAGRGFIQAAALEASNVDLSRALTQLIIIQRGFQANGKTITTSDQLLQTLIGLKN